MISNIASVYYLQINYFGTLSKGFGNLIKGWAATVPKNRDTSEPKLGTTCLKIDWNMSLKQLIHVLNSIAKCIETFFLKTVTKCLKIDLEYI